MATANCQQVKRPRADASPRMNTDDLASITVDDSGVILRCSEGCEAVFGYPQHELTGRHVSTLIPHLRKTELVLEDRVNSKLAFLCRCAMPFEAQHRDGKSFSCELFINRLNRNNVVFLARSLG